MKQSLGFDENITAMLCYLLGWITGLIILLLEKDNSFVRFHAMQSIVVFGILTVLTMVVSIVPFIYGLLLSVLNIIGVILWIVLMIKAYQHQRFELPVASELTNNLLNK